MLALIWSLGELAGPAAGDGAVGVHQHEVRDTTVSPYAWRGGARRAVGHHRERPLRRPSATPTAGSWWPGRSSRSRPRLTVDAVEHAVASPAARAAAPPPGSAGTSGRRTRSSGACRAGVGTDGDRSAVEDRLAGERGDRLADGGVGRLVRVELRAAACRSTFTGAVSTWSRSRCRRSPPTGHDRHDDRDHDHHREHRPRAPVRLRRCFAAGVRRALPFGDGLRAHLRLRRLLGSRGHRTAGPRLRRLGRGRRATCTPSSTPISRKLLIAIHASVTNPSFSNYGAVHGVIAEHELLSSNAGTRSTSQWYSDSGAPMTTNTSAVIQTARSRRSPATPSTIDQRVHRRCAGTSTARTARSPRARSSRGCRAS